MEPPFPGMDPYLETPSMWPDVHSSIISAIRDQLQSSLVPNYRAVITPYVAFESLEIAPVRMVVPDVGIFERESFEPGGTTIEFDYHEPPPAPALAPDDNAWLDAHLHERGLR